MKTKILILTVESLMVWPLAVFLASSFALPVANIARSQETEIQIQFCLALNPVLLASALHYLCKLLTSLPQSVGAGWPTGLTPSPVSTSEQLFS